MNATTQIIDILTACGCKPAAMGNGTIKINAPFVVEVNEIFDADAAEYEYIKGDAKK